MSGQNEYYQFENEEVIKKILKHLGLWDLKSKPTPGPMLHQYISTWITPVGFRLEEPTAQRARRPLRVGLWLV